MARVSIGRPPKTCTVLAHIFPGQATEISPRFGVFRPG